MGTEGDFKLYGRGVDQPDPTIREAYRKAIKARIDWAPTEPFHLFAIDVSSAGYLVFGGDGYAVVWDPERGVRRWSQRPEGGGPGR
jgi:hypothetical protein